MKSRLEMIRSAHRKIYGVSLPGFIPVSRREVASVARGVKLASATDDSLSSGDEIEIATSRLVFDRAEIRAEKETDILLTRDERRQLTRELCRKMAIANSPPLAETFASQDVADFVPAIDPEIDSWARAVAAFELDCETLPLLMG